MEISIYTFQVLKWNDYNTYYVQSIENTMLAGGPFPEPFINCLFVDTCSTVALTGFSTKTCFQRKKLKYNNRLIMFTDILKMWGFFQTELILRSNKTQLSSIEINKFYDPGHVYFLRNQMRFSS